MHAHTKANKWTNKQTVKNNAHISQVESSFAHVNIFTAQTVFAEEICRRWICTPNGWNMVAAMEYGTIAIVKVLSSNRRTKFCCFFFRVILSFHLGNTVESKHTNGCGTPKISHLPVRNVKMIDFTFHMDFDSQKRKWNKSCIWNVTFASMAIPIRQRLHTSVEWSEWMCFELKKRAAVD